VSAPNNDLAPPGDPARLGAHADGLGTSFALFSRHATAVTLCLFDGPEERRPSREVFLDPLQHRTGDVWHVHLRDVGPGQHYLYRVEGPFEPEAGHRFVGGLYLLDPYARAHSPPPGRTSESLGYDPQGGPDVPPPPGYDNIDLIPKCVVIDHHFDWQGDRPLGRPLRTSIIYEAHVKGLSAHPSSNAGYPGSYRGVIERIPYLQELGITTLELLPVYEFDENEIDRVDPDTGERLRNYWGYNPISFFAPKMSYAAAADPREAVREFKEMVDRKSVV